MEFSTQLLLLLLLPLLLPLAFSTDPINHYCGGEAVNSGGPLQYNINFVLSDLINRTPQAGFAISSHGNGADTAYGLTRCRGDVPADVCSSCITDAARQLPTLCSGRADARIWYDYCFLHYDSNDFIGKSDTSNGLILYNVMNATDPVRFERAVTALMGGVREAAAGNRKRFGWGVRAFTSEVKIQGMAQCTRDLSAGSCRECLESALGLFPRYCSYHQGCQVLYSSCVVRYEIYDFLFKRDSSGDRTALLGKKSILL